MRKSLSVVCGMVVSGALSSVVVSAQDQQPGRQTGQQRQLQTDATRQQDDWQSPANVKEAIAKRLVLANKMEIELSQLAQQKTKNQRLSQFAETLISDHSKFNEQLNQWKKSESKSPSTPVQADRSDVQQGPRANKPAIQQAPGQRQSGSQAGDEQPVSETLTSITQSAADNALSRTKEMLQELDGYEFDMAFVGQQTVAHIMILAKLDAIKQHDLGQLSQIAAQAATKTEQHLQELKELAEELKNNQ